MLEVQSWVLSDLGKKAANTRKRRQQGISHGHRTRQARQNPQGFFWAQRPMQRNLAEGLGFRWSQSRGLRPKHTADRNMGHAFPGMSTSPSAMLDNVHAHISEGCLITPHVLAWILDVRYQDWH